MNNYTAEEARSRETFLALMWALSHPGSIQKLPTEGDPFHLIAESLLDLETSFYTDNEALRIVLSQTGARNLPVEKAAYHFYPQLTRLEDVQQAIVGTMLYPDLGATLIIGCQLGQGMNMTLSGPGIESTITCQIDIISTEFWALREKRCQYPLGWDTFLVDGQQVLGLPRTTKIQVNG